MLDKTARRVRTRFAPSPTGDLHIGGLRTAVINYLYAKQNGGDFLLRIEDTDQTRLVEGASERLIDMLAWVGIKPDESPISNNQKFGPYYQSQRTDLYLKHANELIEKGEAYHCFCTADRLEYMRNHNKKMGLNTRYDRACLLLQPKEVNQKIKDGIPHVIRQKIPDLDKNTVVFDQLKKKVVFQNSTVDDQILVKADGFPTYHLANVIDDYYMEISHVIRGEEWLPSLPKHVHLYRALGWLEDMPYFFHLPLLLNMEGGKLSKRHGGATVLALQKSGYHPKAVLQFVAQLGSPISEDHKPLTDLISEFDIQKLSTSNTKMDLSILDEINHRLQKQLFDIYPDEVFKIFEKEIKNEIKSNSNLPNLSDTDINDLFFSKVIPVLKGRNRTSDEVLEFALQLLIAPDLATAEFKVPFQKRFFELLLQGMNENKTSIQEVLDSAFKQCKKELGKDAPKKPVAFSQVRLALIGTSTGPSIVKIISVMDRDDVLTRLYQFIRTFS